MLEVQNNSPFTRGFCLDGKEFIFTANQIRTDIPDYFLNPNKTLKFPGLLKLIRYLPEIKNKPTIITPNSNNDSPTVIPDPKPPVNARSLWEYIFFNIETKEVIFTNELEKFCIKNNLNSTSIRKYIETKKPYKGFKIARRKIEDPSIVEGPKDYLKLEKISEENKKIENDKG